jgi:cellulase/cellobiase CelA1
VAKHRAGVTPSFWSVLVLAVAGAVLCAVVLGALGIGRPAPKHATSVAAEPQIVITVSPSASPSLFPSDAPSASPSASPSLSPSKRPKSSPRAPRSPSPTVVVARLSARYMVTSENNNGFIAGVEVINQGQQPATWTVEVTYSGTVRLGQVWNASVQRVGNTYRFRANSGAALGAAQKAQFGYIASGPRGSSRPVRCTINGRTCG